MNSDQKIRLDHSKLYGFKIVSRPGPEQQPAVLGVKIGQKGGIKGPAVVLSPKIGGKVGNKIVKV